MSIEKKPSAKLAVAGNQLLVDAASVEISEELEGIGIEPILLKGPSIARWLYAEPRSRSYADCDLLVPFTDLERARGVLSDQGYVEESFPELAGDRPLVSHPWTRVGSGITVDLHYGLPGAEISPAKLWEVLSDHTESMELRGGRVTVLSPAARAAHLALHAAQHGGGQPVIDLARAVEQLPEELWRDAVDVARLIGALDSFSAGLLLLDQGSALVTTLSLPHPTSVDALMRAHSAPPAARNIEWFMSRPTLREKLKLLIQKVVPSPSFLRARSTLARRGWLGLAAAYVWRPVSLLVRLVPGVIAWRRARRDAGVSRL